jgi:hypothetical protein
MLTFPSLVFLQMPSFSLVFLQMPTFLAGVYANAHHPREFFANANLNATGV